MAHTNAAYDYERLARDRYSSAPKVQQPPELRVVESRRARSRAALRRTAAAFVLVIGIMAAILYNRMILTELTTEVEAAQEEYDQLVSEQRRMLVELEGKTSLRAVEEAARALGMSKAEDYQIEYVDLGRDGDVVVTAKEPGILDTAAASAKDAFDAFLEYIGW